MDLGLVSTAGRAEEATNGYLWNIPRLLRLDERDMSSLKNPSCSTEGLEKTQHDPPKGGRKIKAPKHKHGLGKMPKPPAKLLGQVDSNILDMDSHVHLPYHISDAFIYIFIKVKL